MKKMFALFLLVVTMAGCAHSIEPPFIDNAMFSDAETSRLSWDPVRFAMCYEVEFGTDREFGPGHNTRRYTTRDSSILLSRKFPYNEHYYWRVRAVSWKHERSEWSNTGHLLLRLDTPAIIGPSGEIGEISPELTWIKVPGAAYYEVEIATGGSAFTNVVKRYRTAAQDYFPRPIQAEKGTVYYWRVRGITKDGYTSVWSEPASFVLPGAVVRTETWPRKGVTIESLKPTLSWTSTAQVKRFQVELLYARDLGNTEYDAVVRKVIAVKDGCCEYVLETALKAGMEYAWRVRPLAEDGPGEWSQYYRFRTKPD